MNNFFSSIISEKYRPKKWNEIIGQELVISFLTKLKKDKEKIPRFFIFFGKNGVGKKTCATILLKEFNSCDFNFQEYLFNVNHLNSIEKVIKLLKIIKKFSVSIGKKHHIFLFNGFFEKKNYYFVEFLSNFVKNKISNISFIFCEKDDKNIPNFIIYISKIFKFQNITTKKIFFYLKKISEREKIKIDKESLIYISQLSDGSIGKSIIYIDQIITYNFIKKKNLTKEIINSILGIIDTNYFFKIVNYLLNNELHKILILINKISQKNIKLSNFIFGLKKHFKNLFLYKNFEKKSSSKFNKEITDNYIKQSNNVSYKFLIKSINICYYYYKEIKKNEDFHFLTDICIMKLFELFNSNHNNKKEEIFFLKEDIIQKTKVYFVYKIWMKYLKEVSYEEKNNNLINNLKKSKIKLDKNTVFIILSRKVNEKKIIYLNKNFLNFYQKSLIENFLKFKIINEKEKQENKIFNFNKKKLVEKLIKRFDLDS